MDAPTQQSPTLPNTGELLDDRAAAQILDVTVGTLSVWRSTGRYQLPFVKIGHKVRYRRSDLETWLASRTRQTGSLSE
ncbi:MAG: helix-turn-helix domain-containing protein [Proteobacteria bacterium]|nr:helix-turn-helix domain-containing protein [Pseudomonadota bacterium]